MRKRVDTNGKEDVLEMELTYDQTARGRYERDKTCRTDKKVGGGQGGRQNKKQITKEHVNTEKDNKENDRPPQKKKCKLLN